MRTELEAEIATLKQRLTALQADSGEELRNALKVRASDGRE